MSGVGFWELFLLFIIGLLILGPERLPRVASQIGRWVGRARRTANQLRYQLEREIALADLEKATKDTKPAGAKKPAAGAGDTSAATATATASESQSAPASGEQPTDRGAGSGAGTGAEPSPEPGSEAGPESGAESGAASPAESVSGPESVSNPESGTAPGAAPEPTGSGSGDDRRHA